MHQLSVKGFFCFVKVLTTQFFDHSRRLSALRGYVTRQFKPLKLKTRNLISEISNWKGRCASFLNIKPVFLAKKPKNLNLFYDEKISVYESYARLFVSGNKQRSKPIKIVVVVR